MTAVLLGAALFLVLLGTGFGFLFARLLARDRVTPLPDDWEDIFSPARYKAMERLLEEVDYRYLSTQPGFGRQLENQLRDRRIHIFRNYVNCLAHDFTRICTAIRKLMVESEIDRPDLAGLLMKQHFTFSLTILFIEFKLVLYSLGMGSVDGRDLVRALDNMCAQLRALSAVVEPLPTAS